MAGLVPAIRVLHYRSMLGGYVHIKRLVHFERYEEIEAAIQREHNIKHWSRKWKVRLILADNPDWNDLYDSIVQERGWPGQSGDDGGGRNRYPKYRSSIPR